MRPSTFSTPIRLWNAAALLTGLLMTATSACAAQMDPVAALRQCRTLSDATLRTECYDAIPLLPASAPTAAAAGRGVAAGPASSPEATGSRDAASGFGLPVPTPPPAVVQGIESSIPGAFDGWTPNADLTLGNRQVWRVTDDSEGAYRLRDPKVRITRGAFGSYFMTIEGVRQTPKVKRIR